MSLSAATKNIGIIFFVIICTATIAEGADGEAFCFKFTWLGPEYDNDTVSSMMNMTCADLKLSEPCIEPLIYTYDGTLPDTKYLWENYDRDKIACKLTKNAVCLKWVDYYDGIVEKITYWCGKMTGPHGPIRDGCELKESGSYSSRACACRTPVINGDPREPCNAGSNVSVNFWISLFVLTSAIFALRVAHHTSMS